MRTKAAHHYLERFVAPAVFVYEVDQDDCATTATVLVNGFLLRHIGCRYPSAAANDNKRKTAIELY